MPVTVSDPLTASKLRERDDCEHFIGELKNAISERPGQSLTDEEKELIRGKQDRISTLDDEIKLLARDISMRQEVRDSLSLVAPAVGAGKPAIQYRDAGEYVGDVISSMTQQSREASDRLARYFRAAEHLTTADTPGIVPDPILGPVLDYIDAARPIVSTLGVRAIPGGPTFHRPILTDPGLDTGVALQTAEKTELASKKFDISRLDVSVETYGGYVNVSRQDLDWGQGTMQIVVNQLTTRYARTTEKVVGTDLAATTTTSVLPAAPTAADILTFLYSAAGLIYTSTSEIADVAFLSPDMYALFGAMVDKADRPLFPPVNPVNALGSASASGRSMQVGGFTATMSYALPASTVIVTARSLVEVYEQRIGTLQVAEPSVLGVQVAYAGYFTDFIPNPAGVVKNSAT